MSKGRKGFSSLELLSAFTLLMTVMASTVPLYVSHNRLLSESRRERLALEELANIAERIKAHPSDEFVSFINSLAPSQIATKHLPGVVLKAKSSQTSLGWRVVLEIYWKSVGRKSSKPWVMVNRGDTLIRTFHAGNSFAPCWVLPIVCCMCFGSSA